MFKRFDDGYFQTFADKRSSYSIPLLEQVNLGEQRFYVTPSGVRYPSMSTVVGILGKEAIIAWKKRVGPEEAARVGARASRRGTSVHALAEHYTRGEKDKFIAAFRKSMPDTQANWAGLKEHLDANFQELRGSECQLYSDMLRLSGTTDCIGIYKGKLCVIDFKTSGKWKKREWIDNYFLQGDGYGAMWQERTGETPESTVIIMATDGHHEPQVFEEPFGASLAKLKKLRLDYYKQFRV